MSDQAIINVVISRCPAAEDAKFNQWYNQTHIPMLLKSRKVLSVARYKEVGQPGAGPSYIAIYQFASLKDFQEFGNSPEMAAARKEMGESWGQKLEIVSRIQYEMIQSWDNKNLKLS